MKSFKVPKPVLGFASLVGPVGPPVQMHHGLFRGSYVELMRETLSTLHFCLPMIDRTGAVRHRHQHWPYVDL